MPKEPARTRPVSLFEARQYLAKAEEFLASARDDLAPSRMVAATSLAGHAGICASDAVTGARIGKRSAGEGHGEALNLLRLSGEDGIELARTLARLIALKPKAEYDRSDISPTTASQAVGWADRCVAIARKVLV